MLLKIQNIINNMIKFYLDEKFFEKKKNLNYKFNHKILTIIQS